MTSDYGRGKPGRPKAPPKVPQGPVCETCRCLRTSSLGNAQCAAGRILDPQNCSDYKSAAVERLYHGGTIGRKYER